MNTDLTEENYQALSRYRQERAHETISEIPFLCEQGYYTIQPSIVCIMPVIMLQLRC
jgi:hypothetical protein